MTPSRESVLPTRSGAPADRLGETALRRALSPRPRSSLAEALVAVGGRRRVRDRLLERDSVVRRFDWLLLLAAAALCALGVVLVWSATRGNSGGGLATSYVERDLLNIVIGLVLGVAVAVVSGRRLRLVAPWVYLLACLGLVLTLSPLGATINGSHSWIVVGGGFEVQPSELAKVALVLGLALVLGEWRATPDAPSNVEVAVALALAAVPLGLVLLQPDLGTVLVFVFVLLGVLVVSGAPKRWIALLLLAGVLGCGAVAHLHLLKDYQVKRFTAFVHPEADPRGFGYNAVQARITVGSGGLFGTGLFSGPQTNGRFVPEQHTDFIFTVAGEELGFVGGATVILLLGLVLWRGLRIAARAPDPFGAMVAGGVVCWFAFQTFENIGMTVGIMPITGLPLPFLSYGGSAMFANLVAVGLLENVALSSPRH